jgi:UDP-N-acetylglucosamine diphosphorylase / glucose-1-phosphate thymidylyltransferase / UDP-N-acetylgalactosamine diphosphorylase / glucosamine-1-phosphate N-acetyltransferase / galactosamine-1-phosphate N-acetyltransferase
VNAVIMAAGEATRLRPLTERWPKPVLPIDGRPVIAVLARAFAAAGCERMIVVTGHLAEQVETLLGDGSAFGVPVVYVRQPQPDGSADAVRRAIAGGATAPLLVAAADTLFARGTLEQFLEEWQGAPGAIAARRGQPRSGGKPGVDARIARAHRDPTELTAVPLWGIGAEIVTFLEDLPGPPYELADAFARALDAGLEVRSVVVPGTRDLTHPVDVLRENFPYLENS